MISITPKHPSISSFQSHQHDTITGAMSTSGQRRTRGPAHQNTFAFRHNPKSKKTEKILAMPNEVRACDVWD